MSGHTVKKGGCYLRHWNPKCGQLQWAGLLTVAAAAVWPRPASVLSREIWSVTVVTCWPWGYAYSTQNDPRSDVAQLQSIAPSHLAITWCQHCTPHHSMCTQIHVPAWKGKCRMVNLDHMLSFGNGTMGHLSWERPQMLTDVNIDHNEWLILSSRYQQSTSCF